MVIESLTERINHNCEQSYDLLTACSMQIFFWHKRWKHLILYWHTVCIWNCSSVLLDMCLVYSHNVSRSAAKLFFIRFLIIICLLFKSILNYILICTCTLNLQSYSNVIYTCNFTKLISCHNWEFCFLLLYHHLVFHIGPYHTFDAMRHQAWHNCSAGF